MSDEFIKAVEIQLEGVEAFSVGACPDGCATCEDNPHADQGSFSWQHCESCYSSLGGDRYPAHGLIDGEIEHFDVCGDCLMFHANGEAPDNWEG